MDTASVAVAVDTEFYSPADAAPLLGVGCDETVKRMIIRGQIAATRHPSGRYKILGRHINEYHAKNQAVTATTARRMNRPRLYAKGVRSKRRR